MTKKEHLIDLIKQKYSEYSQELIEKIFDIINKKDWAVFCSQMGDFDYPDERVAVREKMEQELQELNPDKLSSVSSCIEKVKFELENFDSEIGRFYTQSFHTMDQDYKA